MSVPIDDMKASIVALVKQNKINSLIYSLIVPLIVGLFATFYNDLVGVNALLFWAPVTIFVSLALITAYITYDIKLAPDVYVELEQLREQVQYLERSTIFMSVLQEQALALGAMVRENVKRKGDGQNDLKEAIEEICSLLVISRDNLFEFDANELWSFALYVHCSKDNVLRAVWRHKHPKHPSKSNGRDWEPGQGHVGIAWAQAEGKICPDISVSGVWEMFSPTDTGRDYDRSAYASFVSEPIGPLGGLRHPYGVLVATSNRQGRFDIASSLPLRHAASAIAALIYLAYDQAALEALVDSRSPPIEAAL